MRLKQEDGQSIIIVALAMSLFLVGALGLGVDGAHLYAQRQMAQTAADAAALAGIMSIFDNTNNVTGNTAKFSTSAAFTCTTSDAKTPCVYASKNGFGSSTDDTVTIDFPASTAAPGVAFTTDTTDYPVTLIRATIQRNVSTTLMRFLGSNATTVKATAMAGIVSSSGSVPILVTHPTLAPSLSLQGTPTIQICGGPSRSIQVNSNAGTAASTGGNGTFDLSHAGPADPGNCTTGTGADLGVWGGPSSSPSASYGTTGHYVQPASPILDPLASVTPPAVPTVIGSHIGLAKSTSGCPASPKKGCQLYSPGLYTGGIDGKNSTPVFKPGIYYIQSTSGMSCAANCDMYMATGYTDSGAGSTGTGWTGNMLVYNTGPSGSASQAGAFNLGANGSINLVGSPSGSSYDGILFFQDRSSKAQTHSLGGGGGMTLVGTIYLTNTLATMTGSPAQYQELDLSGGSGSGTLVTGEIIVGALHLGGNSTITMNLNSSVAYNLSQVALVN